MRGSARRCGASSTCFRYYAERGVPVIIPSVPQGVCPRAGHYLSAARLGPDCDLDRMSHHPSQLHHVREALCTPAPHSLFAPPSLHRQEIYLRSRQTDVGLVLPAHPFRLSTCGIAIDFVPAPCYARQDNSSRPAGMAMPTAYSRVNRSAIKSSARCWHFWLCFGRRSRSICIWRGEGTWARLWRHRKS